MLYCLIYLCGGSSLLVVCMSEMVVVVMVVMIVAMAMVTQIHFYFTIFRTLLIYYVNDIHENLL